VVGGDNVRDWKRRRVFPRDDADDQTVHSDFPRGNGDDQKARSASHSPHHRQSPAKNEDGRQGQGARNVGSVSRARIAEGLPLEVGTQSGSLQAGGARSECLPSESGGGVRRGRNQHGEERGDVQGRGQSHLRDRAKVQRRGWVVCHQLAYRGEVASL
jgi:hypothetical protein